MSITVAALYRFTSLESPETLREPLLTVCETNAIKGTLLLAREGINGTIAGTDPAIATAIDWIKTHVPNCDVLDVKYSYTDKNPFLRMKVRMKKEIVTMGIEDIDPTRSVGTYVEPEDWNALISDPDVLVIDTRNDYEVGIGTFKGAINPETETFRSFPDWVKNNQELQSAAQASETTKKVAMFCTGGIRCEKSTAYLKQQGISEVYHLKGGILRYLETIPEDESLWEGECFVFDQRVAVKHRLEVGSYDQCFACRYPITQEDKHSPHYTPGVSCPRCYDSTDEGQKARFAERQKQITLARQDGRSHLGVPQQTIATDVDD